MSNLEDTRIKSEKETLADALEFLDTAKFNFACFVDSFKRYLIKSGILKE